MPKEDTRWDRNLSVAADGDGLIGHAGAVLLRKLADQCGLTSPLGAALTQAGKFPLIDRGVALVSMAMPIRPKFTIASSAIDAAADGSPTSAVFANDSPPSLPDLVYDQLGDLCPGSINPQVLMSDIYVCVATRIGRNAYVVNYYRCAAARQQKRELLAKPSPRAGHDRHTSVKAHLAVTSQPMLPYSSEMTAATVPSDYGCVIDPDPKSVIVRA
jgi:hypothetical protein